MVVEDPWYCNINKNLRAWIIQNIVILRTVTIGWLIAGSLPIQKLIDIVSTAHLAISSSSGKWSNAVIIITD